MSEKPMVWGLTAEEIAAFGREAAREAREKAFAAGLPVTFERDGMVMREYPNGQTEIVSVFDPETARKASEDAAE